jgi:hypothetical protein
VAEGNSKLRDLLDFDPKSLDSLDDFTRKFDTIADKLLNDVRPFRARLTFAQTELVTQGKRYRLTEIEFYLVGGVHDDVFTHQDKQQLTCCQWYFHRTGTQYRSGNYKGLDITFGTPSGLGYIYVTGKDCYGGILVRGIQDVSTGKLFDGPCLSVNQILSCNGVSEVTEIVGIPMFLS